MEFGLSRQRQIWIAGSKFDKFCKRKFYKRKILTVPCAVFVDLISVYNYSAELDDYHSFDVGHWSRSLEQVIGRLQNLGSVLLG